MSTIWSLREIEIGSSKFSENLRFGEIGEAHFVVIQADTSSICVCTAASWATTFCLERERTEKAAVAAAAAAAAWVKAVAFYVLAGP